MEEKQAGWFFLKKPGIHIQLTPNNSQLAGTTKLETLVRELMQNSLDARVDKCAHIVVETGEVSIRDIYDPLRLDQLEAHINGTIDLAESTNSGTRILPKCRGQLNLLKAEACRYLKFSDYGTKGLVGVGKLDKSKALWKLTFDDGNPDKENGSAGGVGVGKNATFPFSQLNTVFYVTRTGEGYGLVGSAHLATSKIEGSNFVREPQGNFFLYDNEEDIQNANYDEIESAGLDTACRLPSDIFARNTTGTDVIILGIDGNSALDNDIWAEEFAIYAIKNFYIAFSRGLVELEIKREGKAPLTVTAESCPDVIEEVEKASEDASNPSDDFLDSIEEAKRIVATYQGGTEEEGFRTIELEHPDLGAYTLIMNSSPSATKKSWSIYRSFGMRTVTRDSRSQRPVYAIVIIKDKKGSDLLLESESGNHTEYDFQALGENEEHHRKIVQSFEKMIKTEIGKFGHLNPSDTDIELAGFSNFLSLPEGVKSSDMSGGVKPIVEIETPAPKAKKKKRKMRKRDSENPDPTLEPAVTTKKEKWEHGDGHKEWDHERDTAEDPSDTGSEAKKSYERTINVKCTFRDIHEPGTSTVEIVGKVHNNVYAGKTIDINVQAVDEQGGVNNIIPNIKTASYLDTGELISVIKGGSLIKDVKVDDDGFVKLKLDYEAPFRACLYETAITTQTISVETVAEKQSEESDNESTN